jgi:hypothetical protein
MPRFGHWTGFFGLQKKFEPLGGPNLVIFGDGAARLDARIGDQRQQEDVQ